MNTLLKFSLPMMLSFLVSCGFHPRGQLLIPQSLKHMSIDSQINDQLVMQLISRLKNLGIKILPPDEKPPLQLTLESLNHQSYFSTTSASTNTRQYTLIYTLTFTLVLHDKSELTHAKVSSSRTLTVNANRILGSDDEEITLKQEMQQELIQKLLFRLTARLN